MRLILLIVTLVAGSFGLQQLQYSASHNPVALYGVIVGITAAVASLIGLRESTNNFGQHGVLSQWLRRYRNYAFIILIGSFFNTAAVWLIMHGLSGLITALISTTIGAALTLIARFVTGRQRAKAAS